MNLYHVQDNDRPMYVVAESMAHAVDRWQQLIREENADSLDDPDWNEEPDGVSLICPAYELLLPVADAQKRAGQ